MMEEKICEIEIEKNGKYYCKTHKQHMMYIYLAEGQIRTCCVDAENAGD